MRETFIMLVEKFWFAVDAGWIAVTFVFVLAIYFFKSRREILAESADRFFAFLRWSSAAFALILLLLGAFLSAAQYLIWQQANPAFLPPHQPLAYFLGYAWTNFAKEAVFSIIFALLFLFIMDAANQFSGNRFFYREEPWLAAFGALAAPWPAGMLVVGLVLIAGVLLQVVIAAAGYRGRLPLLWFWLPAMLIAIIFGDIIGWWIGQVQFRV